MGDLVLALRAETGKPLKSEATVLIFSEGRLIDTGESKGGIYNVVLPKGNYDIALTYPSTPRTGYLKRDIAVKEGETNAVAFALPPEGNLRVLVRTKSDSVPRRSYSLTIASGERQIISRSGVHDESTFQLSTGLAYDVMAKYDETEMQKTGIRVQEDKTEEARFVLPYNEGDLTVLLQTKSGNIPRKSFNVAISHKGTVVASDSSAREKFKVFLRDDRTYLVTVKYEDKEWQQAGITVKEDSPTEQSFVLPWDEGTLTVLVRAGGKPLPDSARIVVIDSAGNEVASGSFVKDKFTAVLHADEEYTIRVRYKDQSEQQRKVWVRANRSIEETFSFAQ